MGAASRTGAVRGCGGAVGGDGIAPARLLTQRSERRQVCLEELPSTLWRQPRAVEAGFPTRTGAGAQAHDIPLVRDDDIQLELPVQAADAGIVLTDNLAAAMENQSPHLLFCLKSRRGRALWPAKGRRPPPSTTK